MLYFTDARNPYILSTIFIIFSFIIKIYNPQKYIFRAKILKFIMEYCFPLGFLTTMILTFLLPQSLFEKLNLVLSNRLILNLNGFKTFGVSIFGSKVSFITTDLQGLVSTNYNYVDSSYLQALFLNGVIYLIIILWLSVLACKKIVKNKDYFFNFALLLMSIHGIFDPPLLWIWFSPFCLILGIVNQRQKRLIVRWR